MVSTPKENLHYTPPDEWHDAHNGDYPEDGKLIEIAFPVGNEDGWQVVRGYGSWEEEWEEGYLKYSYFEFYSMTGDVFLEDYPMWRYVEPLHLSWEEDLDK